VNTLVVYCFLLLRESKKDTRLSPSSSTIHNITTLLTPSLNIRRYKCEFRFEYHLHYILV
jgi:hypothetical protein